METHLDTHISSRYNEQLEHIRTETLKMGGLVEQQIRNALKAVESLDAELARKVLESDREINRMEVEIDEACTLTIAQRQPTASDLRLVVSVYKTISDLERMGDEASRVGRMAAQLAATPENRNNHNELRHLGELVVTMLDDALNAFARTDEQLALALIKRDRQVDKEYESIVRQLITFMMEDPRSIPRTLNMLWAARALERIGDRSCNIAEYVVYFVRGEDIRHSEDENAHKSSVDLLDQIDRNQTHN